MEPEERLLEEVFSGDVADAPAEIAQQLVGVPRDEGGEGGGVSAAGLEVEIPIGAG